MEATATQAPARPGGPLADEEVIARILGGDRAFFEVLMRRYNQRAYRAARAAFGRGDDAEVEDVMQQAYLLAFAHLDQFHGAARFSTWLLRIVVNEALARRRKHGRLVLVDEIPEGGTPMQDQPEERAANHELVGLVEAALDRLPDIYRVTFVLREVDGLSTAEAAEVLGVSEEVVKTRLHRAKATVRADLDARLSGAAARAFGFAGARCDRVVAAVMARLSA